MNPKRLIDIPVTLDELRREQREAEVEMLLAQVWPEELTIKTALEGGLMKWEDIHPLIVNACLRPIIVQPRPKYV